MKKYLIYGAGKSGLALYELLSADNSVHIYDDKTLNSHLPILNFGEAVEVLSTADALIISPAVSYDAPLVKVALALEVEVVGELAFSMRYCKARVIAVTGTNGKTTVTEMINHVLKNNGIDSYLLGNGGVPLATKCMELNVGQTVVLEVSSFQLERYVDFDPYISVVTNLAPDHIDRHKTMEEYVNCKKNIFIHQSKDNFALFNQDDPLVAELADLCPCKVKYFSEKGQIPLQNTAFMKYYYTHSISNLQCVTAVCQILGLTDEQISSALSTFRPSKHRLELVSTVNGVTFINDSKGTNIHATLMALTHYDRIALILGGSDKGYEFDGLFSQMQNVKFIVAIGQTKEKILQAAERAKFDNITTAANLENATRICFDFALKNDCVVLLSPACASFDMFKNYEHRGNEFCLAVNNIYIDSLAHTDDI